MRMPAHEFASNIFVVEFVRYSSKLLPKMSLCTSRLVVVFAILLLMANPGSAAQATATNRPPARPLTIAELRQKAMDGDKASQVKLADAFLRERWPAEALDWYKKAADQGSMEAIFRVGQLLSAGAPGTPATQTVQAVPTEGIQWVYRAATNNFAEALSAMSMAYRKGTGVKKDAAQAYAWLQLYTDSPTADKKAHEQLDEMALKMDFTALQEGKRLVDQCKAGLWPKLSQEVKVQATAPFKPVLSGITLGNPPTALLNGKIVEPGDSITISNKTIKCLKIEKDSILVQVEGEDRPRSVWIK